MIIIPFKNPNTCVGHRWKFLVGKKARGKFKGAFGKFQEGFDKIQGALDKFQEALGKLQGAFV